MAAVCLPQSLPLCTTRGQCGFRFNKAEMEVSLISLLVAEGGEQEEVCLQCSEALHHVPLGAFCARWDCSYCYAA